MCLCVELGMLIFGIYAIIAGRLPISSSIVVEGTPARLIGVLMILPLPLGFGAVFVYGALWAVQNRDIQDPSFVNTANAINAAVIVVCFVLMFVLGLIFRSPSGGVSKRRSKVDEDDAEAGDEDDRDEPRRRRTDDEDEDEGGRRR